MKETLIILGNGFDLDLGWKTSYAEFYQAKKARFAEFNGMRYIQDMVQGEHWHDLEGYINLFKRNASKQSGRNTAFLVDLQEFNV